MRVVRLADILLSYLLVLVCAAGIVGGIFDFRYFIAAGAALAVYFVWGWLRLRCPWCGEHVDSGKLLRGLWRTCNCPNCGHEIVVVPFVSSGTPAKLRRAREGGKPGGQAEMTDENTGEDTGEKSEDDPEEKPGENTGENTDNTERSENE